MLVTTNMIFYTDFIHKTIHLNIKKIHLKKSLKTLSCVSLFNATLYVVFKMNKSYNFRTAIDLLNHCYSTLKGNLEGSHNE